MVALVKCSQCLEVFISRQNEESEEVFIPALERELLPVGTGKGVCHNCLTSEFLEPLKL